MEYLRYIVSALLSLLINLGRRPPERPARILVIKLDHLGDVLTAIPALAALRASHPSAHITALVGPWAADLLRQYSLVDAVAVYHSPTFSRGDTPDTRAGGWSTSSGTSGSASAPGRWRSPRRASPRRRGGGGARGCSASTASCSCWGPPSSASPASSAAPSSTAWTTTPGSRPARPSTPRRRRSPARCSCSIECYSSEYYSGPFVSVGCSTHY